MARFIATCLVLMFLGGNATAQDAAVPEPVRQPQPAAYVSMTNLGGSFDFDETDWRAAVARAGKRIYWKIDRKSEMATRVMEVAASAKDAPPFAALYAVNLRPDQAESFDKLMDSLVGKDAGGEFAGAEFVMQMPLCGLLRLPQASEGSMREHYVATIDRSEDRLACYSATIAHMLAKPADFQPLALTRIVVDAMAVFAQAVLPKVVVKQEGFIQPDKWKNDRRPVPREGGAAFAPGEMIMLHAILANVGRDLVGTPLASYEIKLDIVIRDAKGKVVTDQKDAMRFSGTAIHSVPIRRDYFETGVVTGFPLSLLGEYQISYRMTDLNRPEGQGFVEIVKQVTIR